MTQRTEALKLANQVRVERSIAIRDLHAGRLALEEALELESLQSMMLFKLLIRLSPSRHHGRTAEQRAIEMMAVIGCSALVRVGDLTMRQRNALVFWAETEAAA